MKVSVIELMLFNVCTVGMPFVLETDTARLTVCYGEGSCTADEPLE